MGKVIYAIGSFLVIFSLVTAAIIATNVVSVSAEESQEAPSCNGNCGNENCAALNGGECNCNSCPFSEGSCEGQCGGTCGNPSCSAKSGASCGCSR